MMRQIWQVCLTFVQSFSYSFPATNLCFQATICYQVQLDSTAKDNTDVKEPVKQITIRVAGSSATKQLRKLQLSCRKSWLVEVILITR